MKIQELIKKLQKIALKNPDAEVLIEEQALKNAHSLDGIVVGWYIDDGMDAPEVIDGGENPEDYGIDKNTPKEVCLS